MKDMKDLNHTIIFNEREIQEGIKRVAEQINNYFSENTDNVFFVPVLEGVLPFFGNLMFHINFEVKYESVHFSSYKLKQGKEVRLLKGIHSNISDKDIVIVDDIFDKGNTIQRITESLLSKNPNSLTYATLIDRPNNRANSVKANFVGIEYLEPTFLVGFGLDYNGKYRNLPYIAGI